MAEEVDCTCNLCTGKNKKSNPEPEMCVSRVLLVFAQEPPVALVMANGYKLGKFIEAWKRDGAPNEERGYKVQRAGGFEMLRDMMEGSVTFQVDLYSTNADATVAGAKELGKLIDELSNTFKNEAKLSSEFSDLRPAKETIN